MTTSQPSKFPFIGLWKALGTFLLLLASHWKGIFTTLMTCLLVAGFSYFWGATQGFYAGNQHTLWRMSIIEAGLNQHSLEILNQENLDQLADQLERTLDLSLSSVLFAGGPQQRPWYIQFDERNLNASIKPFRPEVYQDELARIAKYRLDHPSPKLFQEGSTDYDWLMSFLEPESEKDKPAFN